MKTNKHTRQKLLHLYLLYFLNLITSQVKIIVCTQVTFYFSNLLLSFLLVCTFMFILASTAKVIREHHLINVVGQPRIKPGTLQFQDNHEMHYTSEANSTSNISVAINFIITILILQVIYILIIITIAYQSHKSPMTSSQTMLDIHPVMYIAKVCQRYINILNNFIYFKII